MRLYELLSKFEETNKQVAANNSEIQILEQKKLELIHSNEQLEKAKQEIIEQMKKERLLEVDLYNVFDELENMLTDYDCEYIVKPIYTDINVKPEDLDKIKEKIKKEKMTLCIILKLASPTGKKLYNFEFKYPVCEIKLTNNKKLIDIIEIQNNRVVVPKEFETSLLVNLDLNDEYMKNQLFYRAVMESVKVNRNYFQLF